MSTAGVSSEASPATTRRWSSHARGSIALVILAPFAIAAGFSAPYWPAEGGIRGLLTLLGWISFVAGGTFRLWATLYIGGRKGRDVATLGPYSLCRHPLYFGSFLLLLSIGLFVGSVTFTVGLLGTSVVYWLVTVPPEEQRLVARLGTAYTDYRRQVPAFIPRLSGLSTPAVIEVDVRCLRIEGRRALRWVWIPLLCQLVTHLQSEAWWPSLWTLP